MGDRPEPAGRAGPPLWTGLEPEIGAPNRLGRGSPTPPAPGAVGVMPPPTRAPAGPPPPSHEGTPAIEEAPPPADRTAAPRRGWEGGPEPDVGSRGHDRADAARTPAAPGGCVDLAGAALAEDAVPARVALFHS